jgi:hypothetical protein
VKDRIQTMDELASKVESCSLDRRCTFMLRTSADLDEMKRVVQSTLDETLAGPITAQVPANGKSPLDINPMNLRVRFIAFQAHVLEYIAFATMSTALEERPELPGVILSVTKRITGRRAVQTYNQLVEKDMELKLPAMTWTVDDEARDLEDALWEASLVAAKMEGARVQVGWHH